jgi:hypothetical protein
MLRLEKVQPRPTWLLTYFHRWAHLLKQQFLVTVLSFAGQGKQTSVFYFLLQETKGSFAVFCCLFAANKGKLPFSPFFAHSRGYHHWSPSILTETHAYPHYHRSHHTLGRGCSPHQHHSHLMRSGTLYTPDHPLRSSTHNHFRPWCAIYLTDLEQPHHPPQYSPHPHYFLSPSVQWPR